MKKPTVIEREIRPVLHREPVRNGARPVLITGGAGFIGSNLAHRLLSMGHSVLLLDDLSRSGVDRNLRWLQKAHGEHVRAQIADVRDRNAVRDAVAQARQVFHFAAQVAVTTSLDDPSHDFSVNAGGTLNVLEAIRAQSTPPPLVYTSTNKVYGGLGDIPLVQDGGRYAPRDPRIRAHGVSEARSLDFHSPYGCSKGTADQYVLDYARSFGLATIVFRMSCIYGPHQFGTEDQGWVAHFLIRALDGDPIVLYGDGMQVRDILFIDDLVDAFLLAQRSMDRQAGTAFNIGGGAANTTSLLELLDLIEKVHGERPDVALREWRTGDQRYYVSDTRRFQEATGWRPRIGVEEGVRRLYEWLRESRAQPTVRAAAEAARRPAAASAIAPAVTVEHTGTEGAA
jgi:CDP-paratose 2-epimerase